MNRKTFVSGEGARGAGKTSTLNVLLQESTVPTAVNRVAPHIPTEHLILIDTHKATSPFHKRALEIHKEWEEAVNSPGEKAENLSWKKFELGILQLRYESDSYHDATNKAEQIFLDRDLDTAVVYSAAEIILSNPQKYESVRSHIALLYNLWQKVYVVCQTNDWDVSTFPHLTAEKDMLHLVDFLKQQPLRDIPSDTFYFFTKDKTESLKRSHNLRIDTALEYNLTVVQQATQDIIQPLYLYSFLIRKQLFPEARVHYLSSDAHNIEELAKLVKLHIKTTTLEVPGAEHIPVKLRIPFDKEHQLPSSIEALSQLIFESTVGSTFPSKREVHINGESNCVYNNKALYEYASLLGLGQIEFVQIQQEAYSQTCPVHWACIEWLTPQRETARIVDLTPFRTKPYISQPCHVTFNGSTYQLTSLTQQPIEFTEVKKEDSLIPERAMEFAYNVEYTFQEESLQALTREGYELLGQSTNESQSIFLTIRLGRLLQKQEHVSEAVELLERAALAFPQNLILAREIAKYVIDGHIKPVPPHFHTYLSEANQIFERTTRTMREQAVEETEINAYYEYRKFIPHALKLSSTVNES